MEDLEKNEKNLELEQVIKEFEDTFFRYNKGVLYKFTIESVEKPLIENTLERVYGNQSKAARILGINRNTLHSKIKKLGIDISKWKEY